MRGRRREHHLSDAAVVLVAAALTIGVWQGVLVGCALLAVASAARMPAAVLGLCLLAAGVGGLRSAQVWQQAAPRHLGSYTGWAELVADPAVFGAGMRVTLEIERERFDMWAFGGTRRKLADHQSGELVWIQGRRTSLSTLQRRALLRHVVGRVEVTATGDVVAGSALATASNRVRSNLRAAAEATMAPDDAALFTGLVIGDDSRQPQALIDAFRASGLSHLTAVSGQNLAYLLAAALPLLRRLRPWWRWGVTLGLVGWFMALTRFEPSILRAGVMAMLAATAYVRGSQVRPVRLLAMAIIGLVLLDPLLVWSVGFWLSVGATAGVCVVGPWQHVRMPGPVWLRAPMAITLGAQVGVALPSVLVFHRLPVVSLPANLAAGPIAGLVMLYGLPAGLVASFLPHPLKVVVMLPASVGTRWVATVARVAAAVEPAPAWAALWWLLGAALLFGWFRRGLQRAPADVPI